MTYLRWIHAPGLITKAQLALGMSQERLGREVFGCSRRTMTRWVQGRNGPLLRQWADLVRAVYPRDRALAVEIATAMGESLVSLALEAAPPAAAQAGAAAARPAPPVSDLVDSVVCAAAEAMSLTPQVARPGLVAAFDRVASVSLTLDEVRAAMRPPPARKKTDR
jgi:hypothetical protein